MNSSSEEMIRTFAEFSKVSIFMIAQDLEIKLHSGGHDSADRSFIRMGEVQHIFSGEQVSFLYKDPEGHRYFVNGQPIKDRGKVRSALYVMSSAASMEQSLKGVRNILLLTGVGAFILAFGITWVIARILSRPLVQMQQATRRIAIGDLEHRLSITSKDELGFLAEAINDLAIDLQRYRDTRQEFFANISHELRTPITYLEGYAKVVRDGLYETEEEKQLYLDIIYQEAHRMEHLVDDLFELAKMEEGKISLTPVWVDFSALVQQAVRKMELKVNEKGIKLFVTLRGEPFQIQGEEKRLEQVILNILENAVRYTEQGQIHVQLSFTADSLLFSVEDTGIGIPEEELPFIFERFYRVEKSRSRQYGGTGLGLAIVNKLVQLHGGNIVFTSQVGVGTCCTVQFPKKWDEALPETEDK
ncbi:hypothetical protein GCM10010912_12710 [Paenibacillus albidus]|uniref:histidine kinase n=1 Tax=Paenibacillus albidus TaxID=2041023 RepID=A0A917C4U0_9BACL|nr:HAMP domain-containing sensor histidine kinase [Paenibacillus albidus]GGF69053.1 hypothetical protein GCM10010912_12710 [Paenibacillus albidus]